MDVSGEGFGCLNFIAPKLTPSSRARRAKDRQMRGDFGGREANIFKPPAE
jgi:hypothetical protein